MKKEKNPPKEVRVRQEIKAENNVFNLSPDCGENPIKKGEEVVFTLTFDNKMIKSIIIDNGIGEATKEQMQAEKYTFKVKPEKTTTYSLNVIFFELKPVMVKKKIVVLDENGKEII